MKTVKGSATETIETPDGAQKSTSEQVESNIDIDPALPQCEVTFGAGFTKPTEPYANVKVYVSIKLAGDVGEQDALYDFCEEWVNGKLLANMQAISEQYPQD